MTTKNSNESVKTPTPQFSYNGQTNSNLFPTFIVKAQNHAFKAKIYETLPENQTGKGFIVTHNGRFHADEALSVSLLRLLPNYKNYGKELLLNRCNQNKRSRNY